MSNDLLPLKTQFYSSWSKYSDSTDTREFRILYEVVDHVECGLTPTSPSILREELKAVSVEYRSPKQEEISLDNSSTN